MTRRANGQASEDEEGLRTILRTLFTALLLATGIDLALSAANGYPLLRPLWSVSSAWASALPVIVFDALLLLPLVGLVLTGFAAARQLPLLRKLLERLPRTAIAVAAVSPALLNRFYRAPGSVDLPVALALIAGAALVLLAEGLLRPGAPRMRETRLTWTVSFLLLPLALWLPSRSLPDLEPEAPAALQERPDGPNLLLIVLDTLRADHLGAYGYERSTSPWLDEFARQATVFEQVTAASSYTLPSHATLFTGLYPESHGAIVSSNGVSLSQAGLADDWTPVQPLSQEATTLAEIALAAGLRTGAVCANVAYLAPHFGIDQGFENYAVPGGGWYSWQPAGLVLGRKLLGGLAPARWDWWYQSRILASGRYYLLASEVNDLALRWLEPRRDERFFLFLNYMDAHAPYMPVDGYRELYPAADQPQHVHLESALAEKRPILDAERAPLVDAYDAEIRYLDDQLRALFEQLSEWGLVDDTIVVIVGDHGESFGERGLFEHATGLHESQVHVPLMIRDPAVREGRRISTRVHLVDVMPTLLEAMGLPAPPELQARSLFHPERMLPVTSHLGPYSRDYSEDAIYEHPWKLILRSTGSAELFDLSADPAESHDLAGDRPELARELIERLQAFKSQVQPRFSPIDGEIDEATLERLRALGYLK